LHPEFFEDSLVHYKNGSSTELTEEATLFLRRLFMLFSSNGESLNDIDLERLFYPCENGNQLLKERNT